jgi:glycosyltransferase involved in cell wall biosynthesis
MVIGIDASRANRKYKTGTEWYSFYLIKKLAQIDADNQYILYTDQPLTADLLDLTNDNVMTAKDKENTNQILPQKIKSPHNNFKVKVLSWPFNFLWTQVRLSMEMLFHGPNILFIPAHALPIIHPHRAIVTIHDIGFERVCNIYDVKESYPPGKLLYTVWCKFIHFISRGKYTANALGYNKWSTKYGLKYAKKIIAVSNFSKNEIIDFYKTIEKKITVVYHGYNKNLYKKINDQGIVKAKLKEYGIENDYLLYVGRLEKKKNIAKLIYAYAIMREQHKDIAPKLVLVGNVGYGFDEIKYAISEFNLTDDVIITGWIPETDMQYFFNGALAFVFPSLYEGFGIPLLQAMACGTPIVASHTASIPEVEGDSALYFNPQDVNDMSRALASIITDQHLRSELIQKGLEHVKNFSWEKCAQDTLKVITDF